MQPAAFFRLTSNKPCPNAFDYRALDSQNHSATALAAGPGPCFAIKKGAFDAPFWLQRKFDPLSERLCERGSQDFIPYLRRNLSTRPPASRIFCFPVKKGWHFEQTSTWTSSSLNVERVSKLLPQAQTTFVGEYSGWISAFMSRYHCHGGRLARLLLKYRRFIRNRVPTLRLGDRVKRRAMLAGKVLSNKRRRSVRR